MMRKSVAGLIILLILVPGIAGALSEDDFEIDTTQNLLNLCTASPGDPLYYQAINFCHGFMVGAYHYHVAESNGPKGVKLVCLPDPPPSRTETVDMFVEWAKARPQYWKEEAVETEFRFLIEQWPCKP